MKKRVLIFSILLLVLIGSVLGAHTSTLNNLTDPSIFPFYETNNADAFEYRIKNDVSSIDPITNILFIINGTSNFIDKTDIYDPIITQIGELTYLNYTVNLSPGFSGVIFSFSTIANQVDEDTIYLWEIRTTDPNEGQDIKYVNIIVNNDSIPPSIFSISPLSGSFIKNESVNFIVNISEMETSVSNSIIRWDFETAYGVSSTADFNQQLNELPDGTYNAVVDLSNPGEDYMFFEYIVNDSVGNSNSSINYLAVDGLKPIVNLETENETSTNNIIYPLQYNASDNSYSYDSLLNPQLTCNLSIDNNYNAQQIISNSSTKTFDLNTTDLIDGIYNWQVSCQDKAGWITNSETRAFLLDRTGPEITLDSPLNGSLIRNGTTVGISVIDTNNYSPVDSVWYTRDNGTTILPLIPSPFYDINTDSWPPGSVTLIVYANDSLNNLAQNTFEFTVDATPPTLNIISPLNGNISNNPVTFLYDAIDLESGIKECILNTNTSVPQTTTSTTNITQVLSEGSHAWTIKCENNVGLFIESQPIVVIVDTTAPTFPDLSLFISTNNTNTLTGNIDINYTVNDPSGISNCSLYLNGTLDQTNTGQNFNLNIITPSNLPYPVYITCTDIVNNIITSPTIDVYYDNIAPVITNIQESIGTTTATITWVTDEFSNSIINYSTNILVLDSQIIDINSVTQHTLTINSLSESTSYYYLISSTDMWGNSASGIITNFNTTSTPPESPGTSSGGGGSSGGSGGGIPVCAEEHFDCTDWGECQGTLKIGSQSRTCTLKPDVECSGDYQPISLRDCQLPLQEEVSTEEELKGSGLTKLTSFAILDGLKSTPMQAILALLFVILTITAFRRYLKSK